MLRPPAASLIRMLPLIRSLISRLAVSCEHLVSFAHYDVMSWPSNPSSSRFTTLRRRPFNGSPAWISQNRAFRCTVASVISAPSKARSRQPRNYCIQVATSRAPSGSAQGCRCIRFVQAGSGRTYCRSVSGSARSVRGRGSDCTADPSVAVIKGADGHEPLMGQGGF